MLKNVEVNKKSEFSKHVNVIEGLSPKALVFVIFLRQ